MAPHHCSCSSKEVTIALNTPPCHLPPSAEAHQLESSEAVRATVRALTAWVSSYLTKPPVTVAFNPYMSSVARCLSLSHPVSLLMERVQLLLIPPGVVGASISGDVQPQQVP